MSFVNILLGWRDVQGLSALAALLKDLGSVPSAHARGLTTTRGSSAHGFNAFFWPASAFMRMAFRHTNAHIYTYIKIKHPYFPHTLVCAQVGTYTLVCEQVGTAERAQPDM